MEYNLELEKEKKCWLYELGCPCRTAGCWDCLMMGVRYIDGLKKLLNIKSQLSN